RPVSAISITAPMLVATNPAAARALTCDLPSPASLARGCEDAVNSAERDARATREHHEPHTDEQRHERRRPERRVDADDRAEDAHATPIASAGATEGRRSHDDHSSPKPPTTAPAALAVSSTP